MPRSTSSESEVTATNLSRLHPRLRTMLNMRTGPLVLMSEYQATVRIPDDTLAGDRLDEVYPMARSKADLRTGREARTVQVTSQQLPALEAAAPELAPAEDLPTATRLDESEPMQGQLPDAEFSVFVEVDPSAPGPLNGGRAEAVAVGSDTDPRIIDQVERLAADETSMSRRAGLFAMSVTAEKLVELARTSGVSSVESGETIRKLPTVAEAAAGQPDAPEREVSDSDSHKHGAGVIIGIIDVEGFDFAHPDFIDPDTGGTRFLAIWDQAGRAADGFRGSPHEARPGPFRLGYGSEILKSHMDAAIAAAPGLGVPATDLEPQTVMAPGSHATHVASIAAGNLGICRRADIVGVSLALAAEDVDPRRSFYDTSRLAHAVDYIFEMAEHRSRELGQPVPVSINISLGTNGHSHDGTAVINRWIDYAVSSPGRAVTVAAGNAGQTDPDDRGGIGHLLGRVHAHGRIQTRGLSQELGWLVLGDGLADISMNELEIWYPAQDRISVQLTAPDGETLPVVQAGEQILNHARADKTRVSIYNDRYHPVNGFNRISVYLEPFFASNDHGVSAVVGVPAGEWTVRLIGDEIRDGTWHAWIERDDPVVIGDLRGVLVAQLPSAFSPNTYSPDMQVSTLACGAFVNSVANLDAAQRTINPTSSRGPTRTGDAKPDIAAPGTNVVAANGFAPDRWIAMTGTSMAAPYISGVVGLMLAVDPELRAAQITSILRRTAEPLAGYTYAWQGDAGYGLVDGDQAVAEAKAFAAIRRRENQ